MIFELNKRYVTRSGLEVHHISTDPTGLGDFRAVLSNGDCRQYRSSGAHVLGAEFDIMTEDQQRHLKVGDVWAQLETSDRLIITDFVRRRQRVPAVAYLRSRVSGIDLKLATLVCDQSIERSRG